MGDRKPYILFARYSAIIFILPTCLLVGYFMGQQLDDWLETSPALTVVFLLLGAAAGFLQVFRLLGSR